MKWEKRQPMFAAQRRPWRPPKPKSPPPRLPEKVLGFRAWTREGYRLRSLQPAGGGWEIGENTAQCRREQFLAHATKIGAFYYYEEPRCGPHAAPHEDCHCGFYACHNLGAASRYTVGMMSNERCVFGAVLGWGRVVVHHDGWRAEHTRVLMLAPGLNGDQAEVDDIASEMGVLSVPLCCLESDAQDHARTVPLGMRPRMPDNDYGPLFGGFVIPMPPTFTTYTITNTTSTEEGK